MNKYIYLQKAIKSYQCIPIDINYYQFDFNFFFTCCNILANYKVTKAITQDLKKQNSLCAQKPAKLMTKLTTDNKMQNFNVYKQNTDLKAQLKYIFGTKFVHKYKIYILK